MRAGVCEWPRTSHLGSVEEIPVAVRQLVRRHIGSMDHLELLMRLHEAPDQAIAAAELQRTAHLDAKTFSRCIADLVAAGLVKEPAADTFQYGPRTVADREDVDALARMYHQRPVTLVKLVYEQPSTPVKSFADAFRLRDDRGGER